MMVTQHSFPDSATDAFKIAIQTFKKALNDDKVYAEILQTTSVEQVYDLTDGLQAEQMKRNSLKGLSKIKPYLERLEAYTGAIDTFVQVKPDILALIWGPIRLLIQWASVISASLVGLINMAAQIGYLLPEFGHAKRMFGDKEQINLLLALFFQDILDFYSVALKFFSMPRLKLVFEALWPKKKTEIEHIIDRVGRHTTMLRNEVGLEHIQAAYAAREDELQHFKQLNRKATRTEYGILEAAIAPTYYDKKLDELRGRLCDGTGDWLLKHSIIQQWLDFEQESESTSRLVWLRGIPGAGKTFLAACVIREIQFTGTECKRIVFAFLTHALSVSTTALSIIHSLIFQLARDDYIDSSGHAAQEESVLQDFVSATSRAALTSDLDTAADLLIKLLKASGPAHIVIDGLDEIDENERDQFLVRVLRVLENCHDARILIASRDEDDIMAALVSKAIEIRADSCNESSIRTYVTSRFHKWIRSREFSAEEKTEIAGLLHPIVTQAKGMFMYAELILRGLDYLDTIDEIRDELRVLPEDLNAAYGRIFLRINEKLPTQHAREKARKILGWVGCSPMPLTIRELEQALSIRVGDFNQIPRGYSTLKIVHLCGPVVEIMDDEVHFVHFTAKEYFFDSTTADHLSTAWYTLSLTKACLTYLCQPQYDPGLDQSSTSRHLVNGVYRLHHFATDAWLKLMEVCWLSEEVDKASKDWIELLTLGRQLGRGRSNKMYKPSDEETDLLLLKGLKYSDVEVYNILCQEAHFRKISEMRLFDVDKVKWRVSDPLTLRRTSAAVKCALDKKACSATVHARHTIGSEPCFGDTIRLNYGLRPYKCPFIICKFHRTGFEDKRLRQAHSKVHDRPWRCDVPDCEYFEIGFISRPMRDEHLDKFHSADEPCQPISTSSEMSLDHIMSSILALIRANKVQAVQSLLSKLNLTSRAPVSSELCIQALCTEVALSGSSEMLRMMSAEFIHKLNWNSICHSFLDPAIKSGNPSINEWLDGNIVHLKPNPYRYTDVWLSALQSESNSTIKSLEPLTIRIFKEKRHRTCCFQPRFVAATGNCPRREDTLIGLWEKLEKTDRPKLSVLNAGLFSVAATTCSLKLAACLLELGACVDGIGSGKKQATPLQRAAMKDSMESAIFMRFLLRHGADPNVEYRKMVAYDGNPQYETTSSGKFQFKTVNLSEEMGSKEISKWLGKSWEELLEDSREARGAKGTSTKKENS